MSALSIEQIGASAVWTIQRPAARNAIDPVVVEALEAAVDAAHTSRTLRAIVLTGEGDQAFIAGADLKFMRSAAPRERADQDARMHALLDRLEALPIPVIAALNGVVMGGGVEVALACDLRIAEPHASFTCKHAALGVTPGWGGLLRLVSRVGRGAASKLLFTAEAMGAEEALRVGLVDELVAQGEARTRALALAHAIEKTSPAAIADLKSLLRVAYREPARLAQLERPVFLARAAADDHAEALAAYFEKRPPRFGDREP